MGHLHVRVEAVQVAHVEPTAVAACRCQEVGQKWSPSEFEKRLLTVNGVARWLTAVMRHKVGQNVRRVVVDLLIANGRHLELVLNWIWIELNLLIL